MPSSLIMSRRDIELLLPEWLDVVALTERPPFAGHSRETFDAVLDLCEPHLVDGRVVLVPEVLVALDRLTRSGLMARTFDEEFGGVQLPLVVAKSAEVWLQAANAATSAYPLLATAAAALLLAHASHDQIEKRVPPLIDGRVSR